MVGSAENPNKRDAMTHEQPMRLTRGKQGNLELACSLSLFLVHIIASPKHDSLPPHTHRFSLSSYHRLNVECLRRPLLPSVSSRCAMLLLLLLRSSGQPSRRQEEATIRILPPAMRLQVA